MSALCDGSEDLALRQAPSRNQIAFFAPGLKRWRTSEWTPAQANRFLAVSITGTACALQCDHCATKALDGMVTLGADRDLFATAQRLRASGTEGLLVSGGSQRNGSVPLARHLRAIGRIRDELGMRVIVHSGVVSQRLARGLAAVGVDGVMLDVIGAADTIRSVYHLDLTPEDFDGSLALLAEHGLPTIPHIVIGLHYGRLQGEWAALEMIARHPISTVILVALTPMVGTPMSHIQPPSIADVSGFFAFARDRMPDAQINLGCGRPMGATKLALDRTAIDHGLNGIAYPADGTISYARERGLQPTFHTSCCSLMWSEP